MKSVPLISITAALESGARPKGGVSIDGDVPSLGGEHLNDGGGFNLGSPKKISYDFFNSLRGGRIAHSDILIVKDGATTGRTCFVPQDFPFEKAAVNEHVFRLAVDPDRASPRYVFHYLRSPAGRAGMMSDFHGATVGGISRGFIDKVQVPLPPLPEQRRIAAILDHADALRAKRRQVLNHLDSLTQSIFQDMFGEIVTTATVGDVATIQGGLQVSTKRASLPITVPYLRVANAHRGRLELSEVKTLQATEDEIRRTRLEAGDLLFVEGHANPIEVGRVAAWSGEIVTCVHQNHLIRGRLDQSRMVPIFALTWLNTGRGAAHFRRAGRTTSGLNTISAATVRSAPIPVPPLDRQHAFAEKVALVASEREAAKRACAADDELLASLQSRAFRGEL